VGHRATELGVRYVRVDAGSETDVLAAIAEALDLLGAGRFLLLSQVRR
jgi:hypothetical protein